MSFEEIKNALTSTGKIVFATGAAFGDWPFSDEAPTEPAIEVPSEESTTEPSIEVGGACKNIGGELCEIKHQHPCVIQACRYLSEHYYFRNADTNQPSFTDLKSELRFGNYGIAPGLHARLLKGVRLHEDDRKDVEYFGCVIEKEQFIQVEDGFDDVFCLFTTGEEIQSIKETFEWYGFKLTGKEHNLLLCKYPNGVVAISMEERRPYDSGYYDNGHSKPYHYSMFKEIVLFNGRRHEGDEVTTEGKWFYRWYIPSEFFKLAGRKSNAKDMKREWNINGVRAVPVEDIPGECIKLHSIDSTSKLKKAKYNVGGNTIVIHQTINQLSPWAVLTRRKVWAWDACQCECGGLESTIDIEPEVEMSIEPEIETEAESKEEMDPSSATDNGEIAMEVGSELWYDVKQAITWFQDVLRFYHPSVIKERSMQHFIDIARACINKLVNHYPSLGAVLAVKKRGGKKVQHKTPQEALLILDEIEKERMREIEKERMQEIKEDAMRKEEHKKPEPVEEVEPEPEPVEEVELDEDPSDTIGDGEVFVEPDEEVRDLIRHTNGWIEAAWRFRNKGVRSEGTVKTLVNNARASVNELLEKCPLIGAVLFQDKTPDEALQLLDEIEAGREQKLMEYVMDKRNITKEKKERAKLPEEEAKQISDFTSWLSETRGKSESTTKLYVSQAKSCVRITGGFNWESYIDSLDNKHTINAAKSASKEWECFLFEISQGKTNQQAN